MREIAEGPEYERDLLRCCPEGSSGENRILKVFQAVRGFFFSPQETNSSLLLREHRNVKQFRSWELGGMDSRPGLAGAGKGHITSSLHGCESSRLGSDLPVPFSFKSSSSRLDCSRRGRIQLQHKTLVLWTNSLYDDSFTRKQI